MAKASLDLLETLHARTAQAMLDELEKAVSSGEPLQASMLAAITKFLKDNHIEATLGEGGLEGLSEAMSHMVDMPYDGEVPEEYRRK